MGDLLGRSLELPGFDPVSNQGVDENFEIALDRLSADLRIPPSRGRISELSVLPGGDLQESREVAYVSSELRLVSLRAR